MIYYKRDENNHLVGFRYNYKHYYYIKNAQEDIIGIMDSDNNVIVNYKYDAYGRVISVTDNNGNEIVDINHIAYINPFRYRSYYYDEETKLYYLNSRYYNPEFGRFINSDSFVSTGQGLTGNNMYSYTENNPINRFDLNGYFWFQVAGAFVGGIIGGGSKIISNVVTGKKWNDGLVGAIAGGSTAGVIATTTGDLASASYASAFTESVVNNLVDGKGIPLKTVACDTAMNGTINYFTGHVANKVVKINSGWFKPQKLSTSFTGNYIKAISKNTALQATMNIGATAPLSVLKSIDIPVATPFYISKPIPDGASCAIELNKDTVSMMKHQIKFANNIAQGIFGMHFF